MKTSDYYFHVIGDPTGVGYNFVAITPAEFFDENGFMYDDHLMIEDILPENPPDTDETLGQMFSEEGEGMFDTNLSCEDAKAVLLAHGFRESEEFSTFVTEHM